MKYKYCVITNDSKLETNSIDLVCHFLIFRSPTMITYYDSESIFTPKVFCNNTDRIKFKNYLESQY
jgi:hypothetical protein